MRIRLSIAFLLLAAVALGGLTFYDPPVVRAEQTGGPEQFAILQLLDGISTGGKPDKLVLDCAGRQCQRAHRLIYTDNDDNRVHFFDLRSHRFSDETVSFPDQGFSAPWLAFDRQRRIAYLVYETTGTRTFGAPAWREIRVAVIADGNVERISLNEEYNEGEANPPDTYVELDGMVYKQAAADNGLAKLFVDNTVTGDIHIITFDGTGLDKEQIGRASYREPLPCVAQPTCSYKNNEGNSLALEPEYQQPGVTALGSADLLYIADDNDNGAFGQAVAYRIGDNDVTPIMSVEARARVSNAFRCAIGARGITVADGADQLIAVSGCQSFAEGSLGIFSTHDQRLLKAVSLPFRDQDDSYTDWYDPNRVFVVTRDVFGEYDTNFTATLHLIYQGEIVASLPIAHGADVEIRGMVFDPYTRRLYIAAGGGIQVVQVNHGELPTLGQAMRTVFRIDPLLSNTYTVADRSADFTFPQSFHVEAVQFIYEETGGPVVRAAANNHGDQQPATTLATQASSRIVRAFNISATNADDQTPITRFEQSYSMRIYLTDAEEMGVKRGTLRLYWWDGAKWVQEQSSEEGGFGRTPRYVLGTTQRTGCFSVQGETEQTYLPILLR